MVFFVSPLVNSVFVDVVAIFEGGTAVFFVRNANVFHEPVSEAIKPSWPKPPEAMKYCSVNGGFRLEAAALMRPVYRETDRVIDHANIDRSWGQVEA
jgi:hypothetical protein